MFPWDEKDKDELKHQFMKEELHPYNIALLQRVFSNNVQLRINRPHPDRVKDDFCTIYYSAVKAHADTIVLGEEIDKSPYSNQIGLMPYEGVSSSPLKIAAA